MSWTAKYRKQRICALTAAIVATAWMPVAMAAEVAATQMPTGEHDFKGLAETGIQREKDAAGNTEDQKHDLPGGAHRSCHRHGRL